MKYIKLFEASRSDSAEYDIDDNNKEDAFDIIDRLNKMDGVKATAITANKISVKWSKAKYDKETITNKVNKK